ncbi:Transaminated amino acid decarboxylase [Nakaseomyces bracarensis]|uniref:Transaminated amino acid decarboxylase n=1 Tax=Nakaseomyces bracarensis TaxID=273131 RepID=A0ABR4NST6_9SACH
MTPVTLNHYNKQSEGFSYETVSLSEYLFRRLYSVGTKSVFGVPGDFNLPLLEYLYEPTVDLRWIGNCNELNAAYAADGYSRYSNKIGCLVTTYGVGELSALNGVAGAFAEDVKVLHVVGVASSKVSGENNDGKNVHHLIQSLYNSNFVGPNHKTYYEMVKDRVSCSTEYLEDINTACDLIDKVIEDIYRYSKPGYIFVPVDLQDLKVSTKNLVERPTITLEEAIAPVVGDDSAHDVESIADLVLNWLYQSTTPCIIGDVLTDRYGGSSRLNQLINQLQVWNFATVMGKSIIDESNPHFKGLYNGRECQSSVIEDFSKCDLIMHFGLELNEINNGHYSVDYNEHIGANVVQFHSDYIRFMNSKTKEEKLYRDINFIHVLDKLLERVDVSRLNLKYEEECASSSTNNDSCESQNNQQITQKLLQEIMPQYLNPGDVVVCETGSVQFGVRDYKFPTNLKYISQGFFLSIGMALPASLGVGIAMQDYPQLHITDESLKGYTPRLILLEGDGAAQMTIQELSTILHNDVQMEIFLWNNDGYTIERAIKGPTRTYNDIAAWNWTKLFEAFGDGLEGTKAKTANCTLETRDQFLTKLREMKARSSCTPAHQIELLEVKMGVLDFPEQLECMVSAAAYNKKKEHM